MIFRVDKRFIKPAVIERWAVVVYERQQRFAQQQADEMIKGLIASCEQVGMSMCRRMQVTFILRNPLGIVVKDQNPLVKWENGQGNISDVRISPPTRLLRTILTICVPSNSRLPAVHVRSAQEDPQPSWSYVNASSEMIIILGDSHVP
jgi:hypothetical protein